MSEEKEYKESDWKLFRKKIPGWQEDYMNRLNEEYIQMLSEKDKNPSDKFWAVRKKIIEDKKSPGVLIDMRRSRLTLNVLDLIADGAITMDDLDEFSDVFKETINFYLEIRNRNR